MGSQPRQPNFLFIGPDRSGTVWVRDVLSHHPQVFIPFSTELFFFDQYYHLGEDWYLEHFLRAKPHHRVVAEASFSYLVSPDAAERIPRMLPDVRLMAALREPVDRALSAYLLLRQLGQMPMDFETAIDAMPELVRHGLYAEHLGPYLDRFGQDRVYTPLFDDLEADPARYARELFEFLALEPVPLPDALYRPVKPAAAPRNAAIARAVSRGAVLARKVGIPDYVTALKSSRLVERALYRPLEEHERPEISPELRERLRDRFRDDVHRLAEITGQDVISRWGY